MYLFALDVNSQKCLRRDVYKLLLPLLSLLFLLAWCIGGGVDGAVVIAGDQLCQLELPCELLGRACVCTQ